MSTLEESYVPSKTAFPSMIGATKSRSLHELRLGKLEDRDVSCKHCVCCNELVGGLYY